MVSWMYAFKRGFIIFLWSIVWGIVGGVIIMVFGRSAIFAIIANPTNTSAWAGGLALFVIGALIGGLISAIGNYATIVKITLESIEETKRPPPPQPST